MLSPTYEVYAVKYATRPGTRSQHFIGGDPHNGPMDVDYYLWVVRDGHNVFVVDTGFTEEMAAKRQRVFIRKPSAGLKLLGVSAAEVKNVIITHLHYDHVGTFNEFTAATFHVQDSEIAYATGRPMCHQHLRYAYEIEDVTGIIRMVYSGRVRFHRETSQLAPGLSLHRVGGHTGGIQCVRVATARGWVVLASDSAQFYEHMFTGRPHPHSLHFGDVLEGYRLLHELADSPQHIIPGHDPRVMQYRRYPGNPKARSYD